jgi:hypothetical protein
VDERLTTRPIPPMPYVLNFGCPRKKERIVFVARTEVVGPQYQKRYWLEAVLSY